MLDLCSNALDIESDIPLNALRANCKLALPSLRVTFSKLQKYIDEQGGYDLTLSDGSVVLSFVPSFPEALEKGATDFPPRVVMRGALKGDYVTFSSFELEEDDVTKVKDPEEAELTYRSWIAFIEDNY